MEAVVGYTLVSYTFAMICGIAIALAVKQSLSLSLFPFGMAHKERIVDVLIVLLALYYAVLMVRVPLATIENDFNSQELKIGIPWAICTLGVPMVLPRVWAVLLKTLGDDAYQWLLTVLTAILSYIIFTIAQRFADDKIQSIMQTHPDQFPGAQRMLTAFFAVCGWIAMLYSIATLITLFTPMVKMRSTGRPLLRMPVALSVLIALLVILPNAFFTYQQAMSTDGHGLHAKRGSVWESLILWTSFMPNRVIEDVVQSETGGVIQQTHLACCNLSPELYIAFVHPEEVVPDKVVVAEPKSGEIADGALAYSYRLSACENSVNPSGIK